MKECYKALYSVQQSLPKWAKVLPEIKRLQHSQYSFNDHMDNIIPIRYEADRETGAFEYRQFTDFILSKFGLLQIIDDTSTTEPVLVAVTFDGGAISRFVGHVTGGYKLVDKRCVNPKTNQLLFGVSGNEKVQSHIHCFPIKTAFAKDTKQLYQVEFGDFFQFLKEYEHEKNYRIKFIYPQDMSSIWKTTGRGGTAKVKTFPCYCCAVTTATLVTPQPKSKCFRGSRCRMPRCYHHEMLTEATLEAWVQQKQQLEEELPYLANPSPDFKRSQVILSSIDELRNESNPYDIAFQPATIEEGRNFDNFLSVELGYRGLPQNGTIREKRQRLLYALESESAYTLMTKLVASTNMDSAFVEVESAIPCIMHGGNRIGEKIFMVLLLEAWGYCTTKTDRDLLIKTVEDYVNSGVFGTEDSRSQWKLPVTNESELDAVTFTAWRVRKVLGKLSDLARLLLQEQSPERLVRWQQMLLKYVNAIKVAFQHDDFSDEEIEIFQDLIDEWFYEYVELVGLPGVTNYMHLLGAGHLYHYIKKWGNLYRYQQQGWEMKNGMISAFVHRRTRRGGAGGKYGEAHTSRIVPVMQWFQRSIGWITGEASIFFN
jgi:Holliday junction resolvase RusA-like endonuclease